MILSVENSSAYFLTPPRSYAMGIGNVNIYVITTTSFNGSGGKIREIPFSVWIHWMCRCESGKGKTAEINGCERVGNAHGLTYSSHCCSGTKFNAENVKIHLKCRHNFLICSPASPQPLSTLYFPQPQKALENSPGNHWSDHGAGGIALEIIGYAPNIYLIIQDFLW